MTEKTKSDLKQKGLNCHQGFGAIKCFFIDRKQKMKTLTWSLRKIQKIPPPLPGLGTGYQLLKKMIGGVTHPPKPPKIE